MSLSLADINPVLEELYLSDSTIPDQIMRNNPMMGMLPKSTDGGGKYRHVHLRHVRPQGRSAVFATAQANTVGSVRKAFDVIWRSNYQTAEVDGDVIDDAQGNKTIIIEHIKAEMDGALDNLRDDIAMNLFRNEGGARGQIASGITGATITLVDPTDIVNFEIGMVLEASDYDGVGSGTDRTGTATVVALDRDLGTITTSADWDTLLTTLAALDFLFEEDDRGVKMAGFDSWIPEVAPTGGDSHFGVDRSVDPVRLAGVRYDGTGQPLEEAIVQGAARVRRWKKASPIDCAFLNPTRYAALEVSLEGRKRVQEVKGSGPAAHIGYNAIMIASPHGDIPVLSDPNCQEDICWLINKGSWMIETVGAMARLLDEDGNAFLRKNNADGYELRVKNRGNMWCREPGSNGRIAI